MSEQVKTDEAWRLTIYVKPHHKSLIKEMATEADRSASYIIAKAIEYYYETGFQEAARIKP